LETSETAVSAVAFLGDSLQCEAKLRRRALQKDIGTCDRIGPMNLKELSRLISAVSLGLLFGLWQRGILDESSQLGRTAYTTKQAQYFDLCLSHLPAAASSVGWYASLALVFFVLYEVMASAIFRVLSGFTKPSRTLRGPFQP
jgi:hypothetical protein